MSYSNTARVTSTECFVAQPFAGLAFLLDTVWILTAKRIPTGRKQIIVAHLDVHLRNLDCARRMVWYVKFDVERSQLLELQLVDDDTFLIRQR